MHVHTVRYITKGPQPAGVNVPAISWWKVCICIGKSRVWCFEVPPLRGFRTWLRLRKARGE